MPGDLGVSGVANDVQPAEPSGSFRRIEEAVGVEFQAPESRGALAGDEEVSLCEQRVNSRRDRPSLLRSRRSTCIPRRKFLVPGGAESSPSDHRRSVQS